jgi:predicted HTH domain antitoxin
MLNQLSIEYPPNLPDILQMSRKSFEEEAIMAMAVKLFEMKKLSSGMAASITGTNRVSFLLNLHRFNVPMIDLEEVELQSDMQSFNIRISPDLHKKAYRIAIEEGVSLNQFVQQAVEHEIEQKQLSPTDC